MSNERIVRQQYIISGAQQHGKTFWSENFIKHYIAQGHGGALVYNYGRSSDYGFAEEITILSFQQHAKRVKDSKAYEKNPKVYLFEYKRRVYHLRDFNRLLGKKAVRLKRIDNRKLENEFFAAVFRYIHNIIFCFDDSRALVRHGLSEQLITLFSRRDHTGEFSSTKAKTGVEIIFQYHNFDNVKPEQITYATGLLLFRHNDVPSLKEIQSKEIRDKIAETIDELRTGENLRRCIFIDLSPGNYLESKEATLIL